MEYRYEHDASPCANRSAQLASHGGVGRHGGALCDRRRRPGCRSSFEARRRFRQLLRDSFLARPWGIYPHATLGAIALLVGPLQFRRTLWIHRRALHRRLGKVYVVCASVTGMVGMYMAAFSFGGWITHVGFGLLGFFTLTSTLVAYARIRQRRVAEHRKAMIFSFSCIFAAVTLRVELPLLVLAFGGNFSPAYAVVSWLCWVPNLAWASW